MSLTRLVGKPLNPVGLRHCIAGAERADDAGEMCQILDFYIHFISVEWLITVGQLKIDDIGIVACKHAGHFRKCASPVVEDDVEPSDRPT